MTTVTVFHLFGLKQTGRAWRIRLNEYIDAPKARYSNHEATGGVFQCPSDNYVVAVTINGVDILTQTLRGSYAHTKYLATEGVLPNSKQIISKMTKSKNPGKQILLSPFYGLADKGNFINFVPPLKNSIRYDHLEKDNFLFLDGHVESYTRDEMNSGLEDNKFKLNNLKFSTLQDF